MQREAAKSPYLDAVARGQTFSHVLQDCLDRELYVSICQLSLFLRYSFDQFGLCHCKDLSVISETAFRPFIDCPVVLSLYRQVWPSQPTLTRCTLAQPQILRRSPSP